jgi:putative transposase
MPWGLKRYQNTNQSHFITFCCYHRQKLFLTDATRRVFEAALERVRRNYRLRVYGYVVMPEHVHLLVSEPDRATLADALKSLKQGVSRRLIGNVRSALIGNVQSGPLKPDKKGPRDPFKPDKKGPRDPFKPDQKAPGGPFKPDVGLSGEVPDHFWQKRYYDFNVRNHEQFVEKLRYIHRNPVKAGLCECPEDWEWSSFNHYATGCEGRVEIESEWTARKRERAESKLCPAVELPHSSQKQA